jgi:hypothetical protein
VGSVAQLWNPRSNRSLRRYWISSEDQIIIGGENLEQTGVLSLRPVCQGELRARLRVKDRKFEESVSAGNDIAIWINGLKLFIGVKAIDDERMLLAFGIAPGAKVNVILYAGVGDEAAAKAFPWASGGVDANESGCPIGLCQTRS